MGELSVAALNFEGPCFAPRDCVCWIFRQDMHQMEAGWDSRWAQQVSAMHRLHSHVGLEQPPSSMDPAQRPSQPLSSPESATQQVDPLHDLGLQHARNKSYGCPRVT